MNGKTTDLYFLRCLTNLHAGSGDTSYGVIDKEVQRDTISSFPVIHSSGLKGAFREYLAWLKNPKDPKKGNGHDSVICIFGNEKKADSSSAKLSPGSHSFFDAHLLVLPVRSNVNPFFRATSPGRLSELLEKTELFVSAEKKNELKKKLEILLSQKVTKGKPLVFNQTENNIRIENWTAEYDRNGIDTREAEKILGTDIALLHNDDLKMLCGELPVIARNSLENGISQNLWYEEVVPRESRFYSFVACSENEKSKLWEELNSSGNSPAKLIQVGANATIGYGLCEIIRETEAKPS